MCPWERVRGERGGNKGKEQGGGREDGYLKKICCIMQMKSCLKVYLQYRGDTVLQ
jgi:hypothetical protein